MKATGLNHLHLNVTDLARSERFYREVFGLEVGFRVGATMVFLRAPGAVLTLNSDPAERAKAGDSGGIAHFGFGRPEGTGLDAAIAEVERGGGRLVSRGEHRPGMPYAYVADPDGYVIEL